MPPSIRKSSRGSLAVAPGVEPIADHRKTDDSSLRPLAACWLSERTLLIDGEDGGRRNEV